MVPQISWRMVWFPTKGWHRCLLLGFIMLLVWMRMRILCLVYFPSFVKVVLADDLLVHSDFVVEFYSLEVKNVRLFGDLINFREDLIVFVLG